MINLVLLYLGAALTALWGVAHLFPTSSVVKGFGPISTDNQRLHVSERAGQGGFGESGVGWVVILHGLQGGKGILIGFQDARADTNSFVFCHFMLLFSSGRRITPCRSLA